MNTYRELYKFQDLVLLELSKLNLSFYLTGGTALGRFYLHHRWSDDLDFFTNSSPEFSLEIKEVNQKILSRFDRDSNSEIVSEDFYRTFLHHGSLTLKLEFVNDVAHYTGDVHSIRGIRVDNLKNILCNKLTALLGRDEPKDVFDILFISLNYSFNWKEIFAESKEKSLMNEIDIIQRLSSFPIEFFDQVKWRHDQITMTDFRHWIEVITNDFTFAANNSLGMNKPHIDQAVPILE